MIAPSERAPRGKYAGGVLEHANNVKIIPVNSMPGLFFSLQALRKYFFSVILKSSLISRAPLASLHQV